MEQRFIKFIEENMDFIDTNNWQYFFNKAQLYFLNGEVRVLAFYIESAGINTTKERQECLEIHIQRTCASLDCFLWNRSTPMALELFVSKALESYYGFTVAEIVDYIWENRDNYKKYLSFGDHKDAGVMLLL